MKRRTGGRASPRALDRGRLPALPAHEGARPPASKMHEDRGSALLVAIVFTIILTTTVGGVFVLVNASMTASNRSARVQASMQLAEAGIEKAAALLRADRTYIGERDTALGDGAFSVAITSTAQSDHFLVVSTAILSPGGAHPTRIEAELALSPNGARIVAWKEFAQ